MKKKEEQVVQMEVTDFFQHGVAFIPTNEPNVGDVLLVLGKNGEKEMLHRSARSYLQQLAKLFGVDLSSLRNRYGVAIGKKQLIPLPFALKWTLIPIQVRKPIGKQQAHGWIVKQAIEHIYAGDHILLKGGHRIPLLNSHEDMKRILREAQLVELHFQLLHQPPQWVKESREDYLYIKH